MMKKIFIVSLLWCVAGVLFAQDITLPKPVTTGGKPLMDALNARQSNRTFAEKELSMQQLSDLLWATFGVNRPDGKRTAPSAMNMQEIDIYVFLKTGAYLYDAKANKLVLKAAGDLRGSVGQQPFLEKAPVVLVFAADFSKTRGDSEGTRLFAGIDVGYISQNVYLYAASTGMNTVAVAMVKKDELVKLLGITNGFILLGQPVGFPQ